MWATPPGSAWFCALPRDQTYTFVHARQELYQLNYILSPFTHLKSNFVCPCNVETLHDFLEAVSYLVSTVQELVVETDF